MIRRNLLFKAACILFLVSAALLIAAMILHAVFLSDSDIAAAFAIAAAAAASAGILTACLSKEKKEEGVELDEE